MKWEPGWLMGAFTPFGITCQGSIPAPLLTLLLLSTDITSYSGLNILA